MRSCVEALREIPILLCSVRLLVHLPLVNSHSSSYTPSNQTGGLGRSIKLNGQWWMLRAWASICLYMWGGETQAEIIRDMKRARELWSRLFAGSRIPGRVLSQRWVAAYLCGQISNILLGRPLDTSVSEQRPLVVVFTLFLWSLFSNWRALSKC